MSKRTTFLSFLLLALLVALAVRAAGALPMSRQGLIEAKYAGWSGVLRLWVAEGWQTGSGSLSGWLNACIERFERAHPGVYVQAEPVDAAALRAFADSGINPPDMLLFPPGMLEAPARLLPIASDAALRPPLARTGTVDGTTYALPVAMGVYAWAFDRARLPAIPETWRDAAAAPILPEDDAWHSWSAAVLALCSGSVAAADVEIELPGLDLGLPASDPSPAPIMEESGEPCALPGEIVRSAAAWSDFLNGKAAAIPVTQWEIRRLELLADAGRGPDWQIAPPGRFLLADQLALLAIVDWPRADAADRQALCGEFLAELLTPDCQALLSRARAFPVTAGVYAYPGRGAMAQLEAALAEKRLVVPPAFGNGWREAAPGRLAEFAAGRLSAEDALCGLPGLTCEKPEHSSD